MFRAFANFKLVKILQNKVKARKRVDYEHGNSQVQDFQQSLTMFT